MRDVIERSISEEKNVAGQDPNELPHILAKRGEPGQGFSVSIRRKDLTSFYGPQTPQINDFAPGKNIGRGF